MSTYTGNTVVDLGTLTLSGGVSIASSAVIRVKPNGVLDVGAVVVLFGLGVAASTALIDGKPPTADFPWLNPPVTASRGFAKPSSPPTQDLAPTTMSRKAPEFVGPK